MTATPSHALVLTVRPGNADTLAAARTAARAALATADTGRETWLAPDAAWEIGLAMADPATARATLLGLRRALAAIAVDVNLVDADPASRRKRLLVSDMDSTIIQQECIDEMADMAGLKPLVAGITERAMRGELDFEAALAERLALLAGLSEADLARVLAERITLMPGARPLTATMRANGAFTALVSGGFTYFTSRIAAMAGFEVHHANQLEMRGDQLTGRAILPILGREAKLQTLIRYRTQQRLVPADTLAVGDGANDLAMIDAAGLGVAYRAKPVVADQASASIVHGDLTGLLYLQGYRRDEFAAA